MCSDDPTGFHLRLTRSLPEATGCLRERYAEDPPAHSTLIASGQKARRPLARGTPPF